MRAFDLLSKAEQDIRTASQPRYQFEMVLLKWMHLRKLVPLTELIEAGGAGLPPRQLSTPKAQLPTANSQLPRTAASKAVAAAAPNPGSRIPDPGSRTSNPESRIPNPGLKDALLAEIRSIKSSFYGTVVAQAQRIDVNGDRVTFFFAASQSMLREWFDQQREWLEAAAERIAGRKMSVVSATAEPGASAAAPEPQPAKPRDLKAEALSSSTVQAMLDVFPAEIHDVEEM
jgi:DNA polymerase III gamma/tau subunit